MAINDLPMLSALRTKMQWHQERQRVLAENISNSDTPNFKPRDLVEPKFDSKGTPAAGAMVKVALLPAKLLSLAKTRLSSMLDDEQRMAMAAVGSVMLAMRRSRPWHFGHCSTSSANVLRNSCDHGRRGEAA